MKWDWLFVKRTGLGELAGQKIPRHLGTAISYMDRDEALFVVMPLNVVVRQWDRLVWACRRQKPNERERALRMAYMKGFKAGRDRMLEELDRQLVEKYPHASK